MRKASNIQKRAVGVAGVLYLTAAAYGLASGWFSPKPFFIGVACGIIIGVLTFLNSSLWEKQ